MLWALRTRMREKSYMPVGESLRKTETTVEGQYYKGRMWKTPQCDIYTKVERLKYTEACKEPSQVIRIITDGE